jgi:hypothetical protein
MLPPGIRNWQLIIPHLCNAQSFQHKVNGIKDAILYHQQFCKNFTAYFRQQHLHRAPYFGTFYQMLMPLRAFKIISAKAANALAPKMLVKLTPCPQLFSLGPIS